MQTMRADRGPSGRARSELERDQTSVVATIEMADLVGRSDLIEAQRKGCHNVSHIYEMVRTGVQAVPADFVDVSAEFRQLIEWLPQMEIDPQGVLRIPIEHQG